MAKEIEIKILNIEPASIRKKLKILGAKTVKKVLQRNEVYNSPLHPNILMRLRYEGKIIFFTVKGDRKKINGIAHITEYESQITDDVPIRGMFELLGFTLANVRELKREYYQVGNCIVEICMVPTIPPFLELEGSHNDIDKTAKLLGFSPKDYEASGLAKIYPAARGNLVFKKK